MKKAIVLSLLVFAFASQGFAQTGKVLDGCVSILPQVQEVAKGYGLHVADAPGGGVQKCPYGGIRPDPNTGAMWFLAGSVVDLDRPGYTLHAMRFFSLPVNNPCVALPDYLHSTGRGPGVSIFTKLAYLMHLKACNVGPISMLEVAK